ncbi:hypothetical protein CSC82_09900 [Rhodobacteraceae bacterium 4F10]|nr:hypothetical protein CSC82_09900 [Rhodobacteraceae bacterium 4F10]
MDEQKIDLGLYAVAIFRPRPTRDFGISLVASGHAGQVWLSGAAHAAEGILWLMRPLCATVKQ